MKNVPNERFARVSEAHLSDRRHGVNHPDPSLEAQDHDRGCARIHFRFSGHMALPSRPILKAAGF